MPDLAFFLALWLATLLGGAHLLADHEIVLGDGLPGAAAWLIRCVYLVATGAVALTVLRLAAATRTPTL